MFLTVNLAQDQSKISRYLSSTLLDEIENTLKKWEKILIYLNKRGSHNSLVCKDCQHLWECQNCDVSLSVHNNPRKLLCHLCGNSEWFPLECKNCHGTNLLTVGVGTQQIEETLGVYFKKNDLNIYRFDSDSMKNISSKKAAIGELEAADIIIGTKMITTGFDFERVGLIGVVLVEQELGYPSFDAEERAYANLKQLIGRWNRKSQETNIVLQTFIPKHQSVLSLTETHMKGFFIKTLKERQSFSYPPYRELIRLEYRDTSAEKTLQFIGKLESKLQEYNTDNAYTIISSSTTFRKNNSHHGSCIVKWENLRDLLKNIEPLILRTSKLSVVFS